jgi:hypothetical protein
MDCPHCGAQWEDWGPDYCPACQRNYRGDLSAAAQREKDLCDLARMMQSADEAVDSMAGGWEEEAAKCPHCGAEWECLMDYCPACHRNYGGAVYPATQTEQERQDIAQLVGQIHRAFDHVVLGGGLSLHQAHLEGAYSDERVFLAARERDTESHWSDVIDKLEEWDTSTLSFFDPEGWRFYLPAFMCKALKDDWRKTGTWESVAWNLRADEDSVGRYMLERYETLDRAQSKAVSAFLAFFDKYSGRGDARRAIQSYWHRFKDG